MSWNVACSGKTVWEPALIVGRMFLDELRVLEQIFRSRSGIVDNGELPTMVSLDLSRDRSGGGAPVIPDVTRIPMPDHCAKPGGRVTAPCALRFARG